MMRKPILLLLLVTLLLLASPSLAKGQGAGGWDVFTPVEGLVSDDVRAIAEDSEGGLWLGTTHGAYRYDGHAFTPYPDLENRQVDAILLDREDRLWFGTNHGVYYQPPAGPPIQRAPIRDSTYSIAQDQDGALWFGTANGVYRYEGQGEPEQYREQYWVWAVWWDDRRHSLWIGTEVGVICYDGQDFIDVPPAETGRVWAIGQDHQGDLWFGTDNGVYRYDEERQAVAKAFAPEDGPLYDRRVGAIFKDADDHLWFGTVEGANSYNGRAVVPLDLPEGLVGEHVQAIWQDSKEGCLWFGTTGGLGRFKGHFWKNYTTEYGLPSNPVRAIWRDDRGDLWLGTDSGACSFDGTQFTPHITGLAVLAIRQEREGALWFGTSDGAYRYDGRRLKKPPELDGKEVRAIAQDAAGALWFATNQGVSRLDKEGLVTFTVGDGLVSNNVNAILLDSNSILWVGTPSGVSRYYQEGRFEGFDLPPSDLDIPNVLAIQEDSRGDIWFGTNHGAIRYRRQKRAFDDRRYLVDRHVHSIFQDGLGNLWLGTDGGAYARPIGEEAVWEEPAFTTDDGLVSDSVLSIWRDDGGDLWFGTMGGLSRYRPSGEPPWVRIELYVGDEKAARQPSEERITLDYDENNVRIELVGGDLRTHPQDLRYRYQLEGESEVLTSNEEIFYRLGYRKVRGNTVYHFEARALDGDLKYSPPDSLEITVKAQPPRRMPEFYALVAVAALAYPALRRFSKEHRYSDLEVIIGRGEGAFDLFVSASRPRPKVWAAVVKVLRGLGVRPPDPFAPRREIVPSPLPTSLPGGEMPGMLKKLREGAVDGRFLQYLGGRLFDAIFVGEIRKYLFKRTRWRRSVRLRLCFQEDASGLASLPWEYMYGGERLRFLGASPQVAVTRYRPPEEAVERSRTTRPLRILAVIANPLDLAEQGLEPIDVQKEKDRLKAVWQELNAKGQVVKWKFDEEATMEALHSELGKEEGYDIVHFIAHGDFQEDGGGLLYLKDEESRCFRVFEEELSGLFRAYHTQSKRPPALVVLNTCRSAASAEKGALAGLAPTLVREGKLLAAVGMQFPIGDKPARKFAARFYEALLRNGQVDYAVSMARNAIATDLEFDIRDWGTPVLYTQTIDGVIFELA